jgi:DNA invertase Pin-like site-specific DNA recombinase
VSGKGQVDGDGFPRQRDTIARYAKKNKIQLVAEYVEKGVTGTKELSDRQALSDLFARLDSNGVRMVLVERADRLARDLMVSEILLAQFRERQVKVVECEGGSDLTVADGDPTRKLIRQILSAVAEFDKCVIVDKLRAARNRMRRNSGRCEGRKPYGDREGEGEVIAKIQELKKAGNNLQEIADNLNAENIPTRTGKQWQRQQIKNVLDRV